MNVTVGYVERRPPPPSRLFGKRALDASGLALSGALLMGVTGFLIGFLGPMKYQPTTTLGAIQPASIILNGQLG
jgi:hypothetical protein